MSKVTNFEFYKDEIINMISVPNCAASSLAVVNGEPKRCGNTNCLTCEFTDGHGRAFEGCTFKRKAWLYAEHIEKPKLTKKERQFCELVETGWIARGCDGCLFHFVKKGEKLESAWKGCSDICIDKRFPGCEFSFITWDDEEPWSVEELLKLEVEE